MKQLLIILLTLSTALPVLAQRNTQLPADVGAPIPRSRPLQGQYRPVVVNGFVKYQDYLGNLIDPATLFNIVSTSGTSGTVTATYSVVRSVSLAAGQSPTVAVTGSPGSQTLTFGIPNALPGTPGVAGPANALSVGTVTTGAPGSAVTFTITGTPPNQVVNVSIPQGFSGVTGATPNLTIGTITTLAAGQPATATITGTATNPVINLSLPQGGAGTNGVSPTLTIGSVSTGAAGSTATASISGTYPNLVLNLTIPQGAAGTGGSTAIDNNLTGTDPTRALASPQGKRLSDSVGVHRNELNTLKTVKADAINATFRTVPASFTHLTGQPQNQISTSVPLSITIASQPGDAGQINVTRINGTETISFFGADTVRLSDGTVRTYKGYLGSTPGKASMFYYQNVNGTLQVETGSRDFTPDIAANRTALAGKQNTLVSGTNIKTINGQPILGSGDIVITGGSSNTGTAGKDTLYFSATTFQGTGKSVGSPIDLLPAFKNGSGGTTQVASVTSLAGLAAATTPRVIYDESTWTRSPGNVETNVQLNNGYTAIQYNAGSDHYDRNYMGRAKFEWWRNSAANTWEQMKYASGTKVPIQFANGDYYTNERSYITPNTQFYGNSNTPDSVRIHITGPNPFWLMNWSWFDGTPGKRAEGIIVDGFSIYNESSYVAKKDTNDFYGPISIDGGGAYNIVLRNINYKQVSSTAIVNAILVKMGTNKAGDGVLVDNVRSLSNVVAGRMLVEILNQGDGYNTSNPERSQIPARNVVIRNCIADKFRFGLSVAGNFVGAYVHNNIVRNCTDYGIEIAGPQPGVRVDNNGFGGSQNVLIAGNAEGSIAADYMALNQGQYYRNNYTEGSITGGGIIEIRGGGKLTFTGNTLRIGGGVFIRRTSAGGTQEGDISNNEIVSDATAANMTNKALLYLAGANSLRVRNNTFIRTSSDTQPYVQAATSNPTSGYTATGVASTGSLFFNNMFLGATIPTTYFSTASGSSLTIINNVNQSGLINN